MLNAAEKFDKDSDFRNHHDGCGSGDWQVYPRRKGNCCSGSGRHSGLRSGAAGTQRKNHMENNRKRKKQKVNTERQETDGRFTRMERGICIGKKICDYRA